MVRSSVDKKLGWLELGRGIAALVVVITHGEAAGAPEYLFPYLINCGLVAVAFFFVLSGFIIFYVHADDIDHPEAAPRYLSRRLTRIFPTYWLVLLVDIVLRKVVSHNDQTPLSLFKELFIFPDGVPYISVAWSLRHELLFYGLFLLLILNKRIGVAVFALWLAAIVVVHTAEGWTIDIFRNEIVLNPMNLFFFPGLALGFLLKGRRFSFPIKAPKVSSWAGAISYPLYLCHLSVYFVAGGVFKRLGVDVPWTLYVALCTVASIVAASVISSYYEQPLLRWLRGLQRSTHSQDVLLKSQTLIETPLQRR